MMWIHFQHSAQLANALPLQTSFCFTDCTPSSKMKLHRFIEQLIGILHRRSAQWTRWQPVLSHFLHAHPAAAMC
jgi:hypothetical protein